MFVSCDSNNLRWFAANVSNSYQGQLTHSVALFIGSFPPSHQIRDLSPHLQDPADAFRPLALFIHVPDSLQTHEVLLQLESLFPSSLAAYWNTYTLFQFIQPLPGMIFPTQAYAQLAVRCVVPLYSMCLM